MTLYRQIAIEPRLFKFLRLLDVSFVPGCLRTYGDASRPGPFVEAIQFHFPLNSFLLLAAGSGMYLG